MENYPIDILKHFNSLISFFKTYGAAILAVVTVMVAFLQYLANKSNNRKIIDLQEANNKLQREIRNAQIKKDIEALNRDKAKKSKEKEEVHDNINCYKDHHIDKYQYLDFTGLNYLLAKPPKLEDVWVNLKAIEDINTHNQYHYFRTDKIDSCSNFEKIFKKYDFKRSSLKLDIGDNHAAEKLIELILTRGYFDLELALDFYYSTISETKYRLANSDILEEKVGINESTLLNSFEIFKEHANRFHNSYENIESREKAIEIKHELAEYLYSVDHRSFNKDFLKFSFENKFYSTDLLNELLYVAVDKEDLQNQNLHPLKILILGAPGSGKTTLMRWILLQCCKGDHLYLKKLTPISIKIKELYLFLQKNNYNGDIVDIAIKILENEGVSGFFLKNIFSENNLIFLLDGLDEIAEESDRRFIIEWIQKQNIAQNTMLITSRFSGVDISKGLQFKNHIPVVKIIDFSNIQITNFIHNWYRNIEFSFQEFQQLNNVNLAKEKAKELINILTSDSNDEIRKLATNPLLLTIIAIVHRTRAVLPRERHLLYEECLRVMIELWNVSNRRIDILFGIENCLQSLATMAHHLMINEIREIEEGKLLSILPSKIEAFEARRFLNEMLLKSGLLYKSEGNIGFFHLTFIEYLAACYYAKSENPNEILSHCDNTSYWSETFKLFTNIGNANSFYSEILDHFLSKNYYAQLPLWEKCLLDISVDELKTNIEQQLARKIALTLLDLNNDDKSMQIVQTLYPCYCIYKYASYITEIGETLWNKSTNPFIKSIAASILFKSGQNSKIISYIKSYISSFITNYNSGENDFESLLYFSLTMSNSRVMLLGEGGNKGKDFLETVLKSDNQFLKFFYTYEFTNYREVVFTEESRDNYYYNFDIKTIINPTSYRVSSDISDLHSQDFRSKLRYIAERDHLGLESLNTLREIEFLSIYKNMCQEYLNSQENNFQIEVH